VHPRSLEIFESLGILHPFLTAGVTQRVVRLHSEGRVLGEIDLSKCGSRHGFNLGLSEEVTESILTEYLHGHGGNVERGSRLVALEDQPTGVIARIERNGSPEAIATRWVVGCDGHHSVARELRGIDLAGHDIPGPWAVFDVTLRGWSEAYEANYAYLDVIPVILTALPGRRWRVYLRPSDAESDLEADAVSTIRRYHPTVTFDDVASPARFHCHTRVATRYRSGRVLQAGDAAHVCSPSQGHGMNSGLQDAFNLAWKLALVCQGAAGHELLDSYEAERRPVAQRIAASGDATERAQTVTDAAARRARDATLRAAFAEPTSRHQEAVAEAELDIDYRSSPIVMGDASAALGPGQRLPGTIPVRLAGRGDRFLHELTHRSGHTALLIGGASSRTAELARLDGATRATADSALLEATVVVATKPDGDEGWARIAPDEARRLGVDGVALLLVRPDGHVGLRADHDHVTGLSAYCSLLASGAVR
jgi:2-polyprenyl-6-methoxyphenol hydroxylase-like FAD-dependent oxidoreductase